MVLLFLLRCLIASVLHHLLWCWCRGLLLLLHVVVICGRRAPGHAHETWLELLGVGRHGSTVVDSHHVSSSAAHQRTHVRRTEHPLRRPHELLLVTWNLGTVHLTHITTVVIELLLLLRVLRIHVPIFSCGRIAPIHLHLDLLLQLHHILLLNDHGNALIRRKIQLFQFGDIAAICQLLNVLLSGELGCFGTSLVVLDHLFQLHIMSKESLVRFSHSMGISFAHKLKKLTCACIF